MQKLRPDMDIGKNIQSQRKRCGLTQESTVAQLQIMGLNISRSTYAKIEKNAYNIRLTELVALKWTALIPFLKILHSLLSVKKAPRTERCGALLLYFACADYSYSLASLPRYS